MKFKFFLKTLPLILGSSFAGLGVVGALFSSLMLSGLEGLENPPDFDESMKQSVIRNALRLIVLTYCWYKVKWGGFLLILLIITNGVIFRDESILMWLSREGFYMLIGILLIFYHYLTDFRTKSNQSSRFTK